MISFCLLIKYLLKSKIKNKFICLLFNFSQNCKLVSYITIVIAMTIFHTFNMSILLPCFYQILSQITRIRHDSFHFTRRCFQAPTKFRSPSNIKNVFGLKHFKLSLTSIFFRLHIYFISYDFVWYVKPFGDSRECV